jgi:hydroxymethylpyrimidine pyrophosphatase-like HAD family hydrolase
VAALIKQLPGVYVQGLYCLDGAGNVVFEKKLTSVAVEAAETLARKYDVAVIAYDGDTLYASSNSSPELVAEINEKYGEPTPVLLESRLIDHEPGFHKLLLMDDSPERLTNEVRPPLEELAVEYDCVVTQAIPTMLELLPPGCSKAVGVRKLLEALGVDDPSTQLCAAGDAENDAEMLCMAAIGVAVGNACPVAKDAADVVLQETNDEGGAGLAIELFGLGKVLEQKRENNTIR